MEVEKHIIIGLMENKYYTPSIEEFHVGFEFEILIKNKYWETTSVGKYELNTIAANVNSSFKDYYRVKYLDREDIESFGFSNVIGDIYFLKVGKLFPVKLQQLEYNKIIIFYPEYFNRGEILFQGIIKNKSELKTLLKQLEIIK